jgi:hypothetical protein
VPVIVTPAANRTLGDLKTRIADELARADLASQIALAIPDAIAEAMTHRFWFMEVTGYTLPITAGTASYTSDDIAALVEIDRVRLVVGSQRYTLDPMSDDDRDRFNDGTAPQGQPWAYSRYGDTFSLYPTPVATYTVEIDGLGGAAALEVDGDSNIWTTTGERYIRALAKRNLLVDVIQNDSAAQTQDALAKRYRDEFLAQTHLRAATGEMACNG